MKAIVVGEPTSDDNDPGRSGRIRDANKGTGERIRLARKWAGLNQDEVATRMGLSRASVSNWELGQGIKRGNLLSFAQIAGVSAEWLMTGEPNLAPKGERAPRTLHARHIDAPLGHLNLKQFENRTPAQG
jgi:transcriptional regulator with XRE-family HTH domain